MSYDIYKKLMACANSADWSMGNKNSNKKTNLYFDKIGEESQTAFEGKYRDYEYIDQSLEALSLNYPRWTIALEEDNPFDGVGEDADFGADDTTDSAADDDNPFGGDDSSSGDSFGTDDNPFSGGDTTDNGNPFGGGSDDDFFSGGSDDSNDFFGGGDEEGEQKKKQKEIKLDRKAIIEQEYDINKQVRSVFPKRFLELQDIIKANISMCERVVIQDNSHIEVFDEMIAEYNRLAKIVEDYLAVIIEKPHDDIFSTYFTIYTNLSKLKDIYNDLLNNHEN